MLLELLWGRYWSILYAVVLYWQMHNQQRSGPSSFSYPTEWEGERRETDGVGFTSSTSQLHPKIFSTHFAGQRPWIHQWQLSPLQILQRQNDDGLLIGIYELPRTDHFSHYQSIFHINVSLKEGKHKHGIAALGRQCFSSSSRAIADHCDWIMGNLLYPVGADMLYAVYKWILTAARHFHSPTV